MIPAELLPALQGVVPSHITTCSADGKPNVTAISQVFHVDDTHVAVSQQFFTKTSANLAENPWAVLQVIHPETAVMWLLEVRFVRGETEGAIFDAMEMQLEAIASIQGMQSVFKLRSADVFEVLAIRALREASHDQL